MKKKKNAWPDSPEPGEAIRRLNWFMLAGFVIERIDFFIRKKQVTMTGNCQWNDIGTEYIEGGPFRIKFIGVRNFSVQNVHQARPQRLLLEHPRDFTIEKDLSQNRYYHLKTSSLNDRFGFEIDFEELEIQAIIEYTQPEPIDMETITLHLEDIS